MAELVYIVASLFFLAFLIYIIVLLSYSMLSGAPYAAVGSHRLNTIIELLNIKKGEKIADLGSGDGRIVIAASQKGAVAIGYEINPVLVFISRRIIRKEKSTARIQQKSFWNVNFSEYNSVTIYCTTHVMGRLEKKLQKELKPGSKIVSNHFKFPHMKITKTKNDVHLYIV